MPRIALTKIDEYIDEEKLSETSNKNRIQKTEKKDKKKILKERKFLSY